MGSAGLNSSACSFCSSNYDWSDDIAACTRLMLAGMTHVSLILQHSTELIIIPAGEQRHAAVGDGCLLSAQPVCPRT